MCLPKIKACFLALVVPGLIVTSSHADGVYRYESLGRRDPFVPLVGVTSDGRAEGLEGILSRADVSFEGVMVDKTTGERRVIINGEILKKGDKVGKLSVEEIGYNSVRISIDDREYELELYE
ncbi:MAG: hypothetical protein GF408_03420 [Candidatus Omnitrophica bacterium]|nr:hypothetical protein [Candidatus Omnitrophota bacterium]